MALKQPGSVSADSVFYTNTDLTMVPQEQGFQLKAEGMDTHARAVYDVAKGRILAAVEIPAERTVIFDLLTSQDVTRWRVNPGVFDTRVWSADVTPGGAWHAEGVGRGHEYALEGRFTAVEAPVRLVHTWQTVCGPEAETLVTYLLTQIPGGTRLTLRHEGFADVQQLARTCIGWESSLHELGVMLSHR